MVHKREVNAEGLEKNFATNTMGKTSSWWLKSIFPNDVCHFEYTEA